MEIELETIENERLFLFEASDHIAFITNRVNADCHSHNYVQVTLGVEKDFEIVIENTSYFTKGIIVDSNTAHSLRGDKQWQLYLLINPESTFGETIKRELLTVGNVHLLTEKEIEKIMGAAVNDFLKAIDKEKYNKLLNHIKQTLGDFSLEAVKELDKRIEELLEYISSQPLEMLTVKDLSNRMYLSEGRLSHLFKVEMGISLSSYILHEKLKKALRLVFTGSSITDAALEAGFNNSSHFTRTVRDKLGMVPREITKDSRYMQV